MREWSMHRALNECKISSTDRAYKIRWVACDVSNVAPQRNVRVVVRIGSDSGAIIVEVRHRRPVCRHGHAGVAVPFVAAEHKLVR